MTLIDYRPPIAAPDLNHLSTALRMAIKDLLVADNLVAAKRLSDAARLIEEAAELLGVSHG